MSDTTDGGQGGGESTDRPGFENAARDASEAVRRAAAVLEEELQSGLSVLRRLQEGISENRRVDQEAFDEVLKRLRANGREFIEVASNRIGDLRADDVQELTAQFSSHAQDLFDTTVSLMTIVPDIINRLAKRGEEATEGHDAPTPPRPERPERPEPRPRPAETSAATKPAAKAAKSSKKASKKKAAGSGGSE
jgi:hypothetical protein